MQVERTIRGLPLIVSGERVSNAWATCPPDGDNTAKAVLIPDKPLLSHDSKGEGGDCESKLPLGEGPASH